MPGPFLPRPILEPALARVRTALRPGGVVCFGLYAGADDPLSQAVSELRTVRSGGQPMAPGAAIELVAGAGFTAVHELPRTWALPMRLIVGVR